MRLQVHTATPDTTRWRCKTLTAPSALSPSHASRRLHLGAHTAQPLTPQSIPSYPRLPAPLMHRIECTLFSTRNAEQGSHRSPSKQHLHAMSLNGTARDVAARAHSNQGTNLATQNALLVDTVATAHHCSLMGRDSMARSITRRPTIRRHAKYTITTNTTKDQHQDQQSAPQQAALLAACHMASAGSSSDISALITRPWCSVPACRPQRATCTQLGVGKSCAIIIVVIE
jgi:hypothetical protein